MDKKQNAVLKLGGSLIDHVTSLIPALDTTIREEGQSVLIVPGGAVFADYIRSFAKSSNISDETAHWMAVLSMEQYAYYLIDRTGVTFYDKLDVYGPGAHILLPYRLLRSGDSGLEHSWNVTSDTIAAWVAHRTGSRLVKATDVNGIYSDGKLLQHINADDLQDLKETCVDLALPGFLKKYKMDCIVVNGKYPQRVLAALRGDTTAGTFISGRASFKSV